MFVALADVLRRKAETGCLTGQVRRNTIKNTRIDISVHRERQMWSMLLYGSDRQNNDHPLLLQGIELLRGQRRPFEKCIFR